MRRMLQGLGLGILALALPAFGAAPPHGAQRLRELVVFPELNLNFNFGLRFNGASWIISDTDDLPDDLARLREEVKKEPDNLPRLLELAYLLDTDGQTNESHTCYQHAATLCDNHASANPKDGLNLTRYGEALSGLGQDQKAESYFRRAVLVSSNDWHCWTGLGNFQRQRFGNVLFRGLTNVAELVTIMTSPDTPDFRPTPANLKEAQALETEAANCFDRAVSVAPKDAEPYLQRGGFQAMAYGQNGLLRHFKNSEPFDTTLWAAGFYSSGLVTNLQMAAALNPRNPEYVGATACLTWGHAMADSHGQLSSPADLPADAQQYLHGAITRLENLAQNPDHIVAAAAEKNLGVLHMVLGDQPDAAADLKRSVALDPSRDDAWDLMLAFQIGTASPEELSAICEARLKSKDSARNHLLMARALQRQQKWSQAAEQAQAVLALDPSNVVAEVELLALALKQSDDPRQINHASAMMSDLTQTIGNLPPGIQAAKRRREVLLDLAIAGGLINTPEAGKIAKVCLALVLREHPDDQTARDILSALD